MSVFAGVDWGSLRHAACVVDEQGTVVLATEVAHDVAGLQKLLADFADICPAQQLPVAIERPTGLLVDTLVLAGHPVVPVHPNALKASRPRYRAAGAKSDPGDAFILADVLRTDGHRLRVLHPASDEIRALRTLVRTRDDLVGQRVALTNQLRALLDAFWPGAALIFADLASLIAIEFLLRYPTPSSAHGLGEKRLAAFLARHAYSGRKHPAELLERLHLAPPGLVGPLEEQARGEAVIDLASVLLPMVDRIRRISAAIEHTVAQLPLGRVLMSFPRAGKINAAQILAELGDDTARFPSDDQLAAEAGVAPVTHASGKSRAVVCRFACNKRLRQALTTFADNSRHASPWAACVYQAARSRGCDHPHAVRVLARAWIRVLWRCWQSSTPYEANRHRAAAPFSAPPPQAA